MGVRLEAKKNTHGDSLTQQLLREPNFSDGLGPLTEEEVQAIQRISNCAERVRAEVLLEGGDSNTLLGA